MPKILTALRKTVVFGCVVYTGSSTFGSVYLLAEDSMEPTFRHGQLVVIQQWPWCGDLERGDVLILKHPNSPQTRICKRVHALPGEINPVEKEKRIPQGHVWLEGDNKARSLDSKTYGPVPIGLTEGRVVVRLHPFAWESAWNPQRHEDPPH